MAESVLHCAGCNLRHRVTPYDPQRTYTCPKCQGTLRLELGATEALAAQSRDESSAAPDPLVGQRIAHYHILNKLGQGGMGTVYQAENLQLKRTVALKILPPDLAASNPQHAQRFLREAEAQASLDHPNVVAIHQVRKHESYHLIEMQFLAGGSVADLLRAGPLKAEVAARIAREAAQGLAAAHKKKLVHRDVKPQNILLGEDGTAKVSDFGLAKAVDATGGLTASGLVLGTPHYMSPEQASNARLDGRSDIYSLGTTLYHMLTGTLPFEAESTVGVMYHHCCTRPRSPRDIRPGISQSLANVCLNAMLKVSANRYQTMDEFIADLDRAMSGQSVKMRAIEDVRAPGRVETRRLAPSEPVSQAPPSLAALSKPMRRRAAWAVTLALCVLLGCLMGVRLGNRWLAGKRAETARASPKPVKTEAESAAPTPKPEAPEPASQAPPAPVAPAANPPTPPTTAAIETRREAETTSPKAPVANAAPTPAVSEAAQRDGVPATMDVDLGGAFVMLLVYIPAGEFTMGSPEHEKGREPNEGPLHRVRITKPFYMGVYEVTRGQFGRFVQEAGHQTDGERSGSGWNQKDGTWESRAGVHWRNPLFEQDDEHPVVCVSWRDAKAFCEWLSKKGARTFRLPTEAEWEYVARTGGADAWCFGGTAAGTEGRANLAGPGDVYPYTAPVGRFAPDSWGIHDLIGNVWEWCENWHAADYYENSPADDPRGPAQGHLRVIRGAAWIHPPGVPRVGVRGRFAPGLASNQIGFRLVCELP